MKNNITVGFIGCGNMGGALARAAAQSGCAMLLADVNLDTAARLADEIGGTVAANEQIAAECDYIFLAVKPQVMGSVVGSIAGILNGRTDGFVLVSMAAGLNITTLRNMANGCPCPIIRIMPNTPAGIGEGVILHCNDGASDVQMDTFCDILSAAGMLDAIPEKLIDAASALSGCGPAFVFQFIEALADGAVDCGLPRDKALAYAVQTVIGSAKLVEQSGEHPYALRDKVCSPGGSTIEGVRALGKGGMDSAVMQAVIAAYKRTLELGK